MKFYKFGNGNKNMLILPALSLKPSIYSASATAKTYSSFSTEYTTYLLDWEMDLLEGTTIRDMANDVADFMVEHEISDADIIGCSMGGMIAQCLAYEHSELVAKIVLASTRAVPTEHSTKIIDKWIELAENRDAEGLNFDIWTKVYSKEFLDRKGPALKRIATMVNEDEFRRFLVLAKAVKKFDSSEWLSSIKCPILVIGSDCDKVFRPSDFDYFVDNCGAEKYIFKGLSHALFDEAPEFKEVVKEFFDR